MNANNGSERDDWVLDGGDLKQNAPARRLDAEMKWLAARAQMRAAAYAGARVLLLLEEHPWLAAFQLAISAHKRYDNGQVGESFTGLIHGARLVPGEQIKDKRGEVIDDEPPVEDGRAADYLEQSIWDELADLYAPFRDEDELSEIVLDVERERVKRLLETTAAGEPASGWAAFEALFPERAEELIQKADEASLARANDEG